MSQISIHFTLWQVVFELQAILRQVHQIDPKWPSTLHEHYRNIYNITGTPYIFYQYSSSRKFQFVSPCGQPFSRYRLSWDKCTVWRSKVILHGLLLSAKSQILLHFAIHFLVTIRNKCTKMTPKCPWTLRGQNYPIYVLPIPMNPHIITRFAVWSTV